MWNTKCEGSVWALLWQLMHMPGTCVFSMMGYSLKVDKSR